MNDIAAIVLNYCNWQDTVSCLESLLHSEVAPRWIIVIDNASPNESVDALLAWATGNNVSSSFSSWPGLALSKPIRPRTLRFFHGAPSDGEVSSLISDSRLWLVLVRNSTNAGYAGGNNVGLALGLRLGADACWILNNDTVVHPTTCGALRDRLAACARPGLVGGMVRYLAAPNIVQCCCGGFTNRWTLLTKTFGQGLSLDAAIMLSAQKIEREMNFIYGASVMASRKFVETVGFMDERYFLYCEEQDWAWSAADRFELAYAPDAHTLHREGGSTGMSHSRRSLGRLGLLCRSRLRLAAKHNPASLPIVTFSLIYAAIRLVLRSCKEQISVRIRDDKTI